MRKRLHLCWLAAGALGLTAGVVFLTGAQPTGAGKSDGKEKAETAKVDAALDAWVHQLAERMTDRHDSIRQSARLALVAIGKPALPALKKLAQGEDGASAEAAKKVIRRIDSHGRRGSNDARAGRWWHGRGFGFQRSRGGYFGRGFPGRGPAMQRGRFGPGAFPGARPGMRGGFGGAGARSFGGGADFGAGSGGVMRSGFGGGAGSFGGGAGLGAGSGGGMRGGFGGGVAGPRGARPGTQGGQGRRGREAGPGTGGRGGFGPGASGGAGFGGARGSNSPQED